MNVLDILLNNEPPKAENKEYKLKRLSKIFNGEVIFTLKALSYNKVAEIKEINSEDMTVHIVLAGVVSPDLKSKELMAKYHAATPAELVKAMLLPGEIEDISRAIEKLSGYRITTIEEIKKK